MYIHVYDVTFTLCGKPTTHTHTSDEVWKRLSQWSAPVSRAAYTSLGWCNSQHIPLPSQTHFHIWVLDIQHYMYMYYIYIAPSHIYMGIHRHTVDEVMKWGHCALGGITAGRTDWQIWKLHVYGWVEESMAHVGFQQTSISSSPLVQHTHM